MQVRETAMERYAINRMTEATELLYSRNGMTATQKYEAIQAIFTQLTDHAKTGSRRGLRSFGEVMEDWVSDLEKRFDPSGEQRGMSTGIPSLDRMLSPKGLVKGSLFVIGARPKMGKAQPLNSRILLADGSWTTFRDVCVGDSLASVDGQPSFVSGVFPQGERDIYRVTFSDGRTVDCADDHLWEIHSNRITGGVDVVDTCRLRDMMECVRYQSRIHVPGISGDFGFTQYELGSVRDITRLRGRYAWSKDGTDSWFITDLEDESHPDRYSAQYRAESQPDGIIGIGTWRDFIVCFGSSTIEYFSLTGATTVGAALYVAQPSLMVQKGIAGTYCKTPFADSYAFISNPATGAPSVYIIGSGQVSPIASASIEKILRSYTADELADGVMESLRFDAHELLIIHLPRHVLVYDASSSANGPQWCVLKTGLYDDVYRAIDFIYEGNQITCGDKLESVTGKLQFDISSQYDKQQEHLLFTPLFKADNARVFDLEVESSTGVAQYADRLFLSATTDGINYGREQMIEQNEPFVYDKRVLWKRVGRIRKNVGFKLRVITKSPVTLSGCQIRIE